MRHAKPSQSVSEKRNVSEDDTETKKDRRSVFQRMQETGAAILWGTSQTIKTVSHFVYRNPTKAALTLLGFYAAIRNMRIEPLAHEKSALTNDLERFSYAKVTTALQNQHDAASLLHAATVLDNSTQVSIAAPRIFYSTAMLANESLIRVCLTTNPGFGDQSIAINIMQRLRTMGFDGQYEVIYNKRIKDKVITLFDLPKTIPDIYRKDEATILFEQDSHAAYIEKNPLVINLGYSAVGKVGDICSPQSIQVRSYIQFSSYQYETAIYTLDNHRITQKNSGEKYYVFPIADAFADIKAHLENTPESLLMTQKPALKQFVESMESQQVNVMSVYGKTLCSTDQNNMLQTIAAARHAQLHGTSEFFKPLIIAIYYDYREHLKTLMAFINNNNEEQNESPNTPEIRHMIQELRLTDALLTADIADVATSKKITSLLPGQILLLSMGNLAKKIFDGLYMHTGSNIWPPVREGAGSFHILSTMGIPHFECGDLPAPYFVYSNTAVLNVSSNVIFQEQLKTFYNRQQGYCGEVEFWRNPSTHRTMGEFIIDAHNSTSNFYRYFQQMKKEIRKPENDRVLYALDTVYKKPSRV